MAQAVMGTGLVNGPLPGAELLAGSRRSLVKRTQGWFGEHMGLL